MDSSDSNRELDRFDSELARASKAIQSADALLIGAGAGMGVDSGLPDFRGPEGFWNAYPAYRKLNLTFSDLANPEWFEIDPSRAWGFYGHRYHLYQSTQPHPGFQILENWGSQMNGGVFVFTSNVDGHFQRAGFTENSICEVHGSINYLQCCQACTNSIDPAGDLRVTVDPETFAAVGELPRCKRCAALYRPNILMFGDSSWNPARTRRAARSPLALAAEEWRYQKDGCD